MGDHYGISTCVCETVYHRYRVDRFYGKGTSNLLPRIICVWHPDCLPDDIRVHWKCAVFHYCGNLAEVYIADPADLHIATFYGKQDQCGIYGRAGGRCHCGKLYVNTVFGAV